MACRVLGKTVKTFGQNTARVMRGRKVSSINTTSLERCYILIMKLHVSAYNGHCAALRRNTYVHSFLIKIYWLYIAIYTRY